MKSKPDIFKKLKKFKRKNKEGFTFAEIDTFLKGFPEIDVKKFYKAMGTHTCMEINGEAVTYIHDIELALTLVIYNKKRLLGEWD